MDKPSTSQTAIDIVPKRSIGKIALGTKADQLPKGAVVAGTTGELDGIHFLLEDGRVADVWIEDLRTFPQPVRLAGRTLSPTTSLAELKKLLGPCQEVAVKGGAFFNCSSGVSLGTDFDQQGQFIQLRLRPR